MEEQSRALLNGKDREMVQAGLLDELHYRIEQLGAPGGDDCLTLLHMLEKLTFMRDCEVNRMLAHQVLPLLKDGLGRLVERFCAIEPGECDSSCLSEKIQNYAKAISLIAGWNFAPADAPRPVEADDPGDAEGPCEPSDAEEVKPAEESSCAGEAVAAEEPCPSEQPSAADPGCESGAQPPVYPCAAEEEKPAGEPADGEPAQPAAEICGSEAEPEQSRCDDLAEPQADPEAEPCCDGDVKPER